MKLEFTLAALEDLSRLPKQGARRIVDKMEWFAAQDNPLAFAKPLKDPGFGSHRFRVGAYRILVDVRRGKISVLVVLAVRHRREAYQL
jgi:mRNA interferase RelE/StbE